jgi:hypothetical protein
VRSTLWVPPGRRGVQRGNSLIKGMHHRDWLPFRTCLLQTLLRPFVFSCTFAICSFCPVLFSLPASVRSFPSHLRQSPPCLLSAILAASSDKSSSTWCAASLVGPRRNLPRRWAGSSSLDDLVVGEFVLFNSYITCGLAPPISSFLLLIEEFGLQLTTRNLGFYDKLNLSCKVRN